MEPVEPALHCIYLRFWAVVFLVAWVCLHCIWNIDGIVLADMCRD